MEPSLSSDTLDARYVIDKKGKKTDVILSVEAFASLLQELEDLYDITEAERIIKKRAKDTPRYIHLRVKLRRRTKEGFGGHSGQANTRMNSIF